MLHFQPKEARALKGTQGDGRLESTQLYKLINAVGTQWVNSAKVKLDWQLCFSLLLLCMHLQLGIHMWSLLCEHSLIMRCMRCAALIREVQIATAHELSIVHMSRSKFMEQITLETMLNHCHST